MSKTTWNDPEALLESQRYDKPIPSRTLILSTIEQSSQGLNYDEIAEAFTLTDEEDLEALRRRLVAMVRDGQLSRIGLSYQIANDDDEFDATVEINQRGQGFAVIADDEDLVLPERELRLVFNGDRVRVRPANTDKRGRMQGFISEVIKHKVKELIGELCEYEGEYYVQPASPNAHQPITLERELVEHAGLNVGDMVRIAIDDVPTRDEFATGHIVQSLAGQEDTQIIIPATILEYGLPYEFSEQALQDAQKFKAPSEQEIKHRVDLRDLPLVTIDGEDSRDFDDAVYAEKRKGGGYRVVVAIADVSHYVKVGGALDDEAQQRGTSVYFPHYVLPMLPEALSNDLCSLNPKVDRLCMVCDLTLSRTGRVTHYEFYSAVMHSQARLTYSQVAKFLAGQQASIDNNKAVQKSLETLYQLYKVLMDLRMQRHAMEFDTVETYMTFDDKGAIQKILPRTRNDAHRLIEECMLLANVAAADFAVKHDIPVLYRVHEAPEAARIEKVRDYVKLLGFSFPEQPTQADYQRIIDATKDRIDASTIHAVLLRSMMQAYYTPKNAGHYGLAYEAYTHFTSPIRRYPDLLLHRAIKAKLAQQTYALDGAALVAAGEHYSQTERRADEASRDVTMWLKCHYMQQHLGQEFSGVITAVTDFGMFVTLNDLYVDGMVHISQLGDDYFIYDASLQRLVGQHRGQIFALGDKVVVKVAAVNLEERKIDFALEKQQTSAGRIVREKAPRTQNNQTKKKPNKAQTEVNMTERKKNTATQPEAKTTVEHVDTTTPVDTTTTDKQTPVTSKKTVTKQRAAATKTVAKPTTNQPTQTTKRKPVAQNTTKPNTKPSQPSTKDEQATTAPTTEGKPATVTQNKANNQQQAQKQPSTTPKATTKAKTTSNVQAKSGTQDATETVTTGTKRTTTNTTNKTATPKEQEDKILANKETNKKVATKPQPQHIIVDTLDVEKVDKEEKNKEKKAKKVKAEKDKDKIKEKKKKSKDKPKDKDKLKDKAKKKDKKEKEKKKNKSKD